MCDGMKGLAKVAPSSSPLELQLELARAEGRLEGIELALREAIGICEVCRLGGRGGAHCDEYRRLVALGAQLLAAADRARADLAAYRVAS